MIKTNVFSPLSTMKSGLPSVRNLSFRKPRRLIKRMKSCVMSGPDFVPWIGVVEVLPGIFPSVFQLSFLNKVGFYSLLFSMLGLVYGFMFKAIGNSQRSLIFTCVPRPRRMTDGDGRAQRNA